MAKKAKSKSKGKSKKKPGKSTKRVLEQGIGVLSSIPFAGTSLQTAFNNGLGSPAPTFNIQDKLGYNPTTLRDALRVLNQDAAVGLIVTVGGLITLRQAAKTLDGATKYFISIFGGRNGVSGVGGYFLGGSSLESYGRNPLRIAAIRRRFNITARDEFCLLHNSHSDMAPIERGNWINARVVDAKIDEASADPPAIYRAAFGTISNFSNPKVKAVVVSADPTFFATGAALVQAANAWIAGAPGDRIVCYPLQDYSDHRPTGNRFVLRGPNLKEAYTNLGRKARVILNSTTTPGGTIDDAPELEN